MLKKNPNDFTDELFFLELSFPLLPLSHFSVSLTQLVFSWIVGDLHDIELQPHIALPDAVDARDVRALLLY